MITNSLVSLARGRNIDTITGSQTISSFLPLKTDLDLTSHALYVLELVNQFTAEYVENYRLFELLLRTLEHLSQSNDKELTLRYFELHLLDNVGYRPQLQQCPHCRAALEPVQNYFSPSAGGVLCPDCGRSQLLTYSLSVNALKVLRLLQSSDYDIADRLKVNQELSRDLEVVLRNYMRYLLEKEVKSAAWLDALRGETGR